ncbi:MAG TPA: hypothetical protein VM406_13815 [Noviherbaspirillum sp.]|nr:hypothetical protein [Noviherbaspirillum sp.]
MITSGSETAMPSDTAVPACMRGAHAEGIPHLFTIEKIEKNAGSSIDKKIKAA